MNIFLVGNGFDLAHNLPTKYENFLHTIMFLIKNYSKDMITIGHVFGDSQLHESDWWIQKCYKCYSTGWDDAVLKADEVEQLVTRAKENMWFSYFSTVFDQNLGWIDFEREISSVLSAFAEFFKASKDPTFALEHCTTNKGIQYIISCFSFFYDIADASPNFLAAYTYYTVKAKYCREYPKGSGEWIINKETIVEELCRSLNDFSILLQEYLRIFVEQPLDILLSKKLICLNPKFQNASRVITFNYSSAFEKIYEADHVIHIHGVLGKQIVLGVNPDENDNVQTLDTTFLQFKKYYQRVRFGTDISYLTFMEHTRMMRKQNIGYTVTVFGHSLDVTDKDIIMEVFNLSNEIHILYHDEKAIGGYIKNLVNIFGKAGFDHLRSEKKLRFLPQTP